jgi:hypothetical protein
MAIELSTYEHQLLKEIRETPQKYHNNILQIVRLFRESVIPPKTKKGQKYNFYDLKGVGKEIWEGIDAQEYVNRERESWK